ncbi:hypothetical protein [Sporomusa carbonis]|uniref:hypothetical protein n=1 Tax=Sporomusa carbonis TaxID=3076075 RepID=UPI003C7E5036
MAPVAYRKQNPGRLRSCCVWLYCTTLAYDAENVVYRANSLYQTARKVFIGLTVGLAAVFLVWGLILSRLIKSSMAQVNDVLTKLYEYDFTVSLAEEDKNEFASMNRSLAQVIENMKQALQEGTGKL